MLKFLGEYREISLPNHQYHINRKLPQFFQHNNTSSQMNSLTRSQLFMEFPKNSIQYPLNVNYPIIRIVIIYSWIDTTFFFT